jgi:hypothetical protein
MVKVGDSVIFVDTHRVSHEALVTTVHGEARTMMVTQTDGSLKEMWWEPAVNLVYVSGDINKSDPYGRQLERASSVVHIDVSTAGGYCYSYKTK